MSHFLASLEKNNSLHFDDAPHHVQIAIRVNVLIKADFDFVDYLDLFVNDIDWMINLCDKIKSPHSLYLSKLLTHCMNLTTPPLTIDGTYDVDDDETQDYFEELLEATLKFEDSKADFIDDVERFIKH